jgi:two-component sensor histidine kinase
MSTGDGWYGYADINETEKGIIQKFDLKERDISGHFTYMARDLDGNVWGFTPHELIRINASDLSISQFSFSYGVKSGDFFHFSFLPSGEMVFGGRNEITMANPSELQRNRELPVPYIMQLKVLNRPVASTPLLNLKLSHRENFLSLFFSAKAYTMPQGVVFRYRLKGFDDWVETTTGRLANYTNIPPGDYTFQLQAANNERIWNEHMLEIPVHIATPWWLTWWFRVGSILLFLGGIYWLYRFRIKQIKKKEKLKTQYEKKLANVEMTALLAQMNPHFLFNSLNSIDSYIIRNESGKASEYLNNFARLMRLILQNSRSNYISLKDELEALDLYLQMESLRFRDKFQYRIHVDETLDAASVVIPPMLIQPYVENAIWHGLMHKKDGGCGVVEIHISQDRENNLVCIVRDNGIGRVRAEAIKAQNPGNRKKSMGMQITRDRIEMINKLYNSSTEVKITDLVDAEGQPAGTEVRLVIPI